MLDMAVIKCAPAIAIVNFLDPAIELHSMGTIVEHGKSIFLRCCMLDWTSWCPFTAARTSPQSDSF